MFVLRHFESTCMQFKSKFLHCTGLSDNIYFLECNSFAPVHSIGIYTGPTIIIYPFQLTKY
uniref:Uncharacterized protein n=1 Tax=Lepeophtheirus salmonis TaxID=72036 RepID=A0A0K2U3C4_LEPSM